MSTPGEEASSTANKMTAAPVRDEDAEVEKFEHVLEGVVEDPAQRVEISRVLVAAQKKLFSGPIPPPEMLDHYNQVIPGLGQQLVTAWRDESDHRRAMEIRDKDSERIAINAEVSASEADSTLKKRAQGIAAAIVVLLIACGTGLAVADKEWVASIIFGTTIISIAVIFVLGRMPHNGSGKDKADDN